MRKDAIAVIGRMATGTVLLDGQTVKTNTLCQELRTRYPDRDFVFVDMYQYKRRAIPILLGTMKAFFRCEHIFVLLSKNGRRFFFPLLMGLNRIFRRRMYHDVIGGALPEEAAKSRSLRRQLNRFQVNWVEFSQMAEDLRKAGVTNAEVLPNFKRLQILQPDELTRDHQEPYVFSMFSRVTRDKGMTAAAQAVSEVNERLGRTAAVVHIYGPVEEDYRQEFEQILKTRSNCVRYLGCIPQDQSVEVLRRSFMLLFPSVYRGEGMPGTIIDAFSAGLPVIATNWHFNGELVHSGETGYCYDWQCPQLLAEHMLHAVTHPEEVDAMRQSCLTEVKKYAPDTVMEQIVQKMNEGAQA